MNSADELSRAAALRRAVYLILILTVVGSMCGRIMVVRSKLGQTPLLSANDRSRWSSVRALVDHQTYALDEVIFRPDGRRDREWYTIDLVQHRGRDGQLHYYSSKPPLLATLVAGPYWLLKRLTDDSLAEEPFYFVRSLLLIVNILPLVVYFWLLMRLIERYGTTDFGRVFTMACATWGTLLTAFAVTLNNHLWAAVSVLAAVATALPVWEGRSAAWWRFAVAGFMAAMAVASDLPALSLLALLGAVLLWRSPVRTLLAYLPAALLVGAAFFYTNYLAHDSWRPPYAHRGDGPLLATFDAKDDRDVSQLSGEQPPAWLIDELAAIDIPVSSQAQWKPRPNNRWMLWDPVNQQRLAVVCRDASCHVYEWDNWYDYEQSYWTAERRAGVDKGEPSRLVYTFHVLIGHHGIFSLSPIWLLSMAGLMMWLLPRRASAWAREASAAATSPQVLAAESPDRTTRMGRLSVQQQLAAFVLILSLVCLTFYLSRPLVDRNYGGVTNGFRWMFWFIPLWLLVMLPAADALSSRPLWRAVALALLLVSVFSVSYTPLNPWSHPWLFDYWHYLGWIDYR